MASPGEIVKAGFDAALKPFTDLIMKIAGPAADEIGLMFQDQVKVFRLKRQLRLLERVKEMLGDSEPQRVPLKLFQEVVENASVEESDDLQDRWAALLANAALDANSVHPAFIEVLRQLTSREAQLLDLIADNRRLGTETALLGEIPISDEILMSKRDPERALKRFDEESNNLVRLGLIAVRLSQKDPADRYYGSNDTYVSFTTFGRAFRDACHAPRQR